MFPRLVKDPGFAPLSTAKSFASLRCEEETGRARQRHRAQQQSVGQAALQPDSGGLTHI